LFFFPSILLPSIPFSFLLLPSPSLSFLLLPSPPLSLSLLFPSFVFGSLAPLFLCTFGPLGFFLSLSHIFSLSETSNLTFPRSMTSQAFEACERGDLPRLQSLINKHPQPLINEKSSTGHTLLHIACDKGHTSLVSYLLEQGADPNEEDFLGSTPLDFACKGFKGHLISLLLLHPKINLEQSAKTACIKGSRLLLQILTEAPLFNPEMLLEGVPILTYLIQKEKNELALWVIQGGNHDLLLQDPSFELSLHAAFEMESFSVAKTLLHQSCIRPHLSSSSKETPFQICCRKKNKMLLFLLTRCPNFDLFKAVWEDAKYVPEELFGYLFSFKNVAWNRKIFSKDLLFRACQENNLNLAKYLLHHGLHSPNLQEVASTFKGRSPKITELLLRSPKVLSFIKQRGPCLTLKKACEEGNILAVELLLLRFPNQCPWIAVSRSKRAVIEDVLECSRREEVLKVLLALAPLPPPNYRFPLNKRSAYLERYKKDPAAVRRELRSNFIMRGTFPFSFLNFPSDPSFFLSFLPLLSSSPSLFLSFSLPLESFFS